MLDNSIPILAYIDPATGSLVIQAVIAATVSAGFVFRRFVLTPLAFRFGKKSADGDDAPRIEDDEALA